MTTKITSDNIASSTLASLGGGVKITSVTYPNGVTAANTAGGESITITGSGFASGIIVYADNTSCNTTFTNSTSLIVTAPAKTAGTYTLSAYNTDGSSGLKPAAFAFSDPPSWVTGAGALLSASKNTAYSTTISASGTSITYSVTSGSLPTGLSLNSSSGAITGTPTTPNTYNFTITATNSYNQSVSRAFSIVVIDIINATYLAVAGGGSGGTGYYGGGGGAGGLLTDSITLLPNITYTITIGTGGVGTSNPNLRGGNGGNTSISGTGITTITVYGGGGGGSRNGDASGGSSNGNPGGSGGGACFPESVGGKGVYPGSTFLSQARQGYDGGSTATAQYAHGGGGAGQIGHDQATFGNRNGGDGLSSSITGTSTYYAGGGAGALGTQYGGQGGGGGSNTAGTANSGGGGGGGSGNTTQGGNGGSGVVIISYPDTSPAATTTGSPTVTASGGNRIYKFTGSGTFAIN